MPGELAVGAEDGRGVVVDAGGAPLKQGSDERDLQLARDLAEALGRGTGNWLSQLEQRSVFALAEVLRLKEFGQADEFRALLGGIAHVRDGAFQILFRIRRARHLHDTDGEISFCQCFTPRVSNEGKG